MIYAFAQSFFFSKHRARLSDGACLRMASTTSSSAADRRRRCSICGDSSSTTKEPLRLCRESLRRGYDRNGVGDYQWAGYCGTNHSLQSLLGTRRCARRWSSVSFMPVLRDYLQNTTYLHLIVREAVASLNGGQARSAVLHRCILRRKTILDFGHKLNDLNVLFPLHLPKLAVAVFRRDRGPIWPRKQEAKRNIPARQGSGSIAS